MSEGLSARTAIVTGAARSILRAGARCCAREGAFGDANPVTALVRSVHDGVCAIGMLANMAGVMVQTPITEASVEPSGVTVNGMTHCTPTYTVISKVTYVADVCEIWQSPDVLTPTFASLTLQTPVGAYGHYVAASDHSEHPCREGWR